MAGAARAALPAARAATSAPARLAPASSSPARRSGAPAIPLPGLSGTGGEPLADTVRGPIERSFGADLGGVRVHRGPAAQAAAGREGARAFAYGEDIVLGAGESAGDTGLLAHEAAHVLQQRRGAAAVQRASPGGGGLEGEAASASAAVLAGRPFAVTGAAGTQVQREGLGDFVEARAWSLVREYAPELVPILQKGPEGVLEWLKERITGAFQAMFDHFMAPVRAIGTTGRWLSTHFGPLVTWIQQAAAKIARNDCSPFREAAEKIEEVATAIVTPIVEKIRAVASVVGDFFKGVWERFGAPVWDWIKRYAGQQWDQIQRLATWIWDKTAPVRRLLERAWTWLKNKIGIGEGPEGQNGILQWVQRKAEAAWQWVSAKLEPYKKQLLTAAAVVGGILVLISPAGPVLVVGGLVVGIIQGVRWIKANWKGDVLVRSRAYLEKTLIPQIMGGLNRLTAAIARMAGAINGKLGEAAKGMGQLVGAVAASALSFAVSAMQWLADRVTELVQWGTEKLAALARFAQDAFTRAVAFLKPVLDFLGHLARVVADIYFLPVMLAGRAWQLIPSCIRDPVVDFVVPIVLRQIALFRELVKDNAAWQKTKADALRIVRLVFRDRDLMGAVKAVFHLVLRIFNVPMELLVEIVRKAAQSWDAVMEQPIAFIKNAARAVGHGFKLLWINKWMHLRYGIEGWLFGELADKGISPPASWTNPMDLLNFVLDVLGLSMNHVFELMEKRFDKAKVAAARKAYGVATKVWGWIQTITDKTKSAAEVTAGLIERAKDFAKGILEGVVEWVAGKVATELAVMAAAAAASAGLSQVLDTVRRVYLAIVAATQYMRPILEMVNQAFTSVLEIVRGAIEPAGQKVENVMHRGMPVVIGFLGYQVGLGGIAQKMRELVDELRAKVDAAILWVIDKVKAAIDAIVAGVKAAIGAIAKWWKQKFGFTTNDGASHTIEIEGEPGNADVVVRSKLTYLGELVGKIKDKDDRKAAEAKQREIRNLIAEGRTTKDEQAMNDLSDRIGTKLDEMSQILVRSGVLDVLVVPAPEYSYSVEDGRAKKATVRNLSAIRPWGSTPGSADVPGWQYAQAIGSTTGGAMFRRLHLINERFGGPGMSSNLAVAGKTDNENHLYKVENRIKELVGDKPNETGKPAIVNYSVEVEYGRPDVPLKCSGGKANLKDFPKSFRCEWTAVPDPVKNKKAESAVKIPIPMLDWETELKAGSV